MAGYDSACDNIALILGWVVQQEQVQKGSQSSTQVTSMQVFAIEITCVGKST